MQKFHSATASGFLCVCNTTAPSSHMPEILHLPLHPFHQYPIPVYHQWNVNNCTAAACQGVWALHLPPMIGSSSPASPYIIQLQNPILESHRTLLTPTVSDQVPWKMTMRWRVSLQEDNPGNVVTMVMSLRSTHRITSYKERSWMRTSRWHDFFVFFCAAFTL